MESSSKTDEKGIGVDRSLPREETESRQGAERAKWEAGRMEGLNAENGGMEAEDCSPGP